MTERLCVKIIGLCGGSGSGKTTAAVVMESLGAAIIDTDRVYREICVPGSDCLDKLRETFGAGIIRHDGTLDRGALGAIVFANTEARLKLNLITHKYIREETLLRIARFSAEGFDAVVVDAPLLFEAEFDKLCDVTVGIVSNEDIRLGRIMARDGISYEAARSRIASQISDDELRVRCDYIIENDGTPTELSSVVRSIYMNAVFGGARS